MFVEQASVSRAPAQKKSQRAAEQDRPDVAAAREEWRASQGELNPQSLVFIDETGAATNMARRYGRCPRGQRLLTSVPWGHWKTTTFVAALRVDQVTAPLCSMAQSMARASAPTWSNVLSPCSALATSSSWTTSPAIRSLASARRSKRQVPNCAICRPIVPISIRSAILRRAQSLATQGCRQNARSSNSSDRARPDQRKSARMRKLPRKSRLSPSTVKMLYRCQHHLPSPHLSMTRGCCVDRFRSPG